MTELPNFRIFQMFFITHKIPSLPFSFNQQMRKNEDVCIWGTSVVLIPYCEEHVERYHEWMKSPFLQGQSESAIACVCWVDRKDRNDRF